MCKSCTTRYLQALLTKYNYFSIFIGVLRTSFPPSNLLRQCVSHSYVLFWEITKCMHFISLFRVSLVAHILRSFGFVSGILVASYQFCEREGRVFLVLLIFFQTTSHCKSVAMRDPSLVSKPLYRYH